jgi:syntaxin 1B/2/3
MHERSKLITRSNEMKEMRERMQVDIDNVNKVAHQCKNRIDHLMKMNEQALNRKGSGPGTSSERTRTAITAALSKKLKDLMGDFQNLRSRLQQEYREVVQRRVQTVTGHAATEDEIDKMIDTGESETIFQKAIMEQGRGHALDTLAEVQERHEAVKELEKSLMELHQVFLDMAVLVDAQGEMLDNIEQQVGKARDHVESGVNELVKAKKLQKNTRKWMCCALVLVLIVIAVIVVVAIRPWRFANNSPPSGRRLLEANPPALPAQHILFNRRLLYSLQ